MKQNILITGAAGFIGYHLAAKLKQSGHEVVGYDNFNSYYDPQLKKNRAERLQAFGIDVVRGDICDEKLLIDTIESRKISTIVHLAAQAGVRYSLEQPKEYIRSNVEGFLNVLEACRHHALKLVYASSSSVYGLNTKVPFSTKDQTDRQASLYGATKKSDELMAETYNHLFGIPAIGLRFFTVYGPWGRPDMAYFSFTKAILENKSIDIYNQGSLSRDFTYIDDIVEGAAKAVDFETRGHEIFNLGNSTPVSVNDFVETLEQIIGLKAKKNLMPMQKGDVFTTFADIDKSKELLGYMPKTNLREGLTKFVDWYKNTYRGKHE